MIFGLVRKRGLGGSNGLGHLGFGRLGNHILQGGTGRDHGEDVLILHTLGVNQDGAVIVGQGFRNLTLTISGALEVDTWNPVGASEFAEVGVSFEIDTGLAVLEEEFLPLADHSEVVVVEK